MLYLYAFFSKKLNILFVVLLSYSLSFSNPNMVSYLWLSTAIATSTTLYLDPTQKYNALKVLGIHTLVEVTPFFLKLFKKYNPRFLSYFKTIDNIYVLSKLGLWGYSLHYLKILKDASINLNIPYSTIYWYFNILFRVYRRYINIQIIIYYI